MELLEIKIITYKVKNTLEAISSILDTVNKRPVNFKMK